MQRFPAHPSPQAQILLQLVNEVMINWSPQLTLDFTLHCTGLWFWRMHDNVFMITKGFSGGSDDKESIRNAGDWGSIPGSGRSPGGGHGNPGDWSSIPESGRSPGGVGVCVGGYALENLTSHSLLTTARGSNVCGGRGGPSRLSSDQLCLCKTQKKPRACSTTCFRFTLYRTYSIYILQET